jgi:hypothetical protein
MLREQGLAHSLILSPSKHHSAYRSCGRSAAPSPNEVCPLIHPRHTRNFKVNNRDRSLVTGFNRKITLFL